MKFGTAHFVNKKVRRMSECECNNVIKLAGIFWCLSCGDRVIGEKNE